MSTRHDQNRKSPLLDLFSELEPYSTGHLSVDDTHQIYWEQCGNPDGVPIVYLHGGPGGGINPASRRFFDPDYYRIILFDQRGCGKSTPQRCLTNNTTAHLLADIEQLRSHFDIEQWHVFGGSWGSTLALRYAILHPQRCISMILRGIFLMRKVEIDWFLHGIATIFPEAWEQFIAILDDDEQKDILSSYYKRLTSDNHDIATEAAIDWATYESACAELLPNYPIMTTESQKQSARNIATIEAHYFMHEDFDGENSILNNIDVFRHIPTSIVQGRYDMICPIQTAYELHQKWPEAEYSVVPNGGHSAMDPPVRSKLIEATQAHKKINA